MELKEDIKKMLPAMDQPGNMTHHNSSLESLRMRPSMEKSHFIFRALSLT
jgi:hypothetical protein